MTILYCLLFLFNRVRILFAENEKENDSRGGQATQAIIQRRRRPKRRSTGVCNVGAEVNQFSCLAVQWQFKFYKIKTNRISISFILN